MRKGSNNGYPYVNLRKNGTSNVVTIHTLVLETWVGPRPTIDGERACTRHLNGIKTDNRVENLAWGTMKENMADKKLHGTENVVRGEDKYNAILTEAQVAGFKERMAAGEWYKDIANEIGKPLALIYNVDKRQALRKPLQILHHQHPFPGVPARRADRVHAGRIRIGDGHRFRGCVGVLRQRR